jgi:hypothetical protein
MEITITLNIPAADIQELWDGMAMTHGFDPDITLTKDNVIQGDKNQDENK